MDGALLRCGKIHEGLESFKDWLDNVEATQSKQKPFSIDRKALKPQQQMQEVRNYTGWPKKNRTLYTLVHIFAKY